MLYASETPYKKSLLLMLLQGVTAVLEKEQARYFLWVPVALGAGIIFYFSLLSEPAWVFVFAVILGSIALHFASYRHLLGYLLSALLVWGAIGFGLAKLRTTLVAAPVLESKEKAGEILGWIEWIEPHEDKGIRLTLRVAKIENLAPDKTPFRVRIRLNLKDLKLTDLKIGQFVKQKASLQPPPDPVIPGGFDFGRHLWFAKIGAVGFGFSKPEIQQSTKETPLSLRLSASLNELRLLMAERIRAVLPGESGAIAVALITGEQGAIDEKHMESLRASGLAHILSISGLHMAMIAGAMFWILRAIFAAFPSVALVYPVKKLAALFALGGATYYLLLSGASYPTQRSYLMIAIMFLAILLDRPAVTLRNVALSAFFILLMRPESLMDVGFQMSYAAVIALVALYEKEASKTTRQKIQSSYQFSLALWPVRYLFKYLWGAALTTLIASVAIAPLSAYHFHQLTLYSVLGNLLTLPLVTVLVMPMVLATLVLLPFGLEAAPLWLMGQGLDLMLQISAWVASLPGALSLVPQMPDSAFLLMILGGLWFMLWLKKWRVWGLFVIAVGLALTPATRFPDILVDREAKVIALHLPDGTLATPDKRSGTFSLEQWLGFYGDDRKAKEVRKSRIFRCDQMACMATLKGKVVSFIQHPGALNEDCGKADILIYAQSQNGQCKPVNPASSVVVDFKDLQKNGAHAIYISGETVRVETVRERRGDRLWVGKDTHAW